MVQVGFITLSLGTSAALFGAVIIGVYVVFGGPTDIHKRRRKKDYIPGLANIGNSCFLNALVQSLASCPLFITWLSSKFSDSAPPLVSALHNLLKVLSALRGHGWVISSEEQDTHELFHVLTATIDDELVSASIVPSLLDVSWVDINCMDSLQDGVIVKANSWGQSDEDSGRRHEYVKEKKIQKRNTSANIDIRSNNVLSNVLNGILTEDKHEQPFGVFANGTETQSDYNDGRIVNGSSFDVANKQSCDNKGCEGSDKVKESSHSTSENHIASNSADTFNMDSPCDTTPECNHIDIKVYKGNKTDGQVAESVNEDNENYKGFAWRNKADRELCVDSLVTQARDSENTYWKIHGDHHDSPFRGYLASQLQCTLCGQKNPAQWTSFESLSLSLPSLPWGEVTLQELLDSYITQEKVTDVTCDNCTKISGSNIKTTFIKQLTIGKLPDCLCFHIKRTVWLENGSAIKRRDHLIFPEFLIMDPFTYTTSITTQGQQNRRVVEQDGNSVPNSTYSSGNSCQYPISSIISENATSSHVEASPFVHVRRVRYEQLYRLKAVIVHVGDVFCGHFVTYRRGPIGSRTRNRWFYTSDLLAREASLDEVRKANAYMILYEKVT
ncbi:ubiquitin carboxyl-terminal hydrolase 30-like isoform X2 [Homarus americanus]|uniref:ubiquitin carboxyl-terminal hydrolase 30-like isoform X2 n=1 Tax=Homarus americanus TaxID=6706 RepID=UPI001C449203|nr:ubiquitin carboxyl-terminal hydrolase 30-like isoform X2 [Homarus americanus]